MKFGFVTCVQLGLSCMQAIYDVGGSLDVAITLSDDRAVNKSGRAFLDIFCAQNRIPLIKSGNVNDAAVIDAIRQYDIDWLFIIGWSQIARDGVLAAPRRGALGMHPTLLPTGRGRAAIPWAILKELDKTGVTLFKLDGGVDTGDVIAQLEIPLHSKIDATELYTAVEAAHISLMRKVFPELKDEKLKTVPQDNSKASIWPGRKPEDGLINIQGSVHDAERLVRAVTRPYPGAYFFTNERRTIIWRAEIVDSAAERCDADIYLDFADGTLRCVETETVSETPA